MMDTLLARHSPADCVAYGSAGERTAAELLCDAAAVAHALPERTADKPLALLGVRRDAYACLAALLGAWERGYEVLLPPADATREGFLRLAQRPDVGAVLHDTASSAALPIARLLEAAMPERRLADAGCVRQGVLHLVTSDSTLRVAGISLLREAALLGHRLGLPERAAYACSFVPSTRYAWAAGMFWPLLCGGALLRDAARAPAWHTQLSQAVVIGAPAHVRMLARRQCVQPARVVSLGAPLPAAAFTALRDRGLVISDVYATDALGCIGWRDAVERPFELLPELGLRMHAGDLVRVVGSHVADIAGEGAQIPVIPTADGGFFASGIGAQRAEWEERIAWLEGVHDAALLALPTRGESGAMPNGKGWFVAHSVEPTRAAANESAWHVAVSLDANAPAESVLRARVARELPELAIADWRSTRRLTEASVANVSSFASGACDLERNGAGRHDRASVLRLFGRDTDTSPLSWSLQIESEHIAPDRCVRQVRVPERYGYFAGHFPSYPLLPGAVQLSELVVPFVRAVRPELGRLTKMARLKFQERIVPNDLVEVSLEFAADASAQVVEFSLRRGESLCASGRITFALAPAESPR